jgi:hypothetical protein
MNALVILYRHWNIGRTFKKPFMPLSEAMPLARLKVGIRDGGGTHPMHKMKETQIGTD